MPIKTEEQLDLQAVHRVRERWVMRRTAVVNQIRGLLLERGLTLPKGRSHVDQALPEILADAELKLSDSFRALLTQLKLELEQLYARVEEMDKVIQTGRRARLPTAAGIPGIGPVTATALVAAMGNGAGFRKGRDLAAWVGMVPREYPPVANRNCWASANAATRICEDCSCKSPSRDAVSIQAVSRPERLVGSTAGPHPPEVAIVALANKLLRIAWAVCVKTRPIELQWSRRFVAQEPWSELCAPFPFISTFQNGPRRPGFATPRKHRAPWTAPGHREWHIEKGKGATAGHSRRQAVHGFLPGLLADD